MLEYEIIVDHGETPNKCTITPLAYRTDFCILRGRMKADLRAELLLHPEGRPLHTLDLAPRSVTRLAAIDCVWGRLAPILRGLKQPLPTLVSIPGEFVTAYPRRSKKDFDPEGGLATIEALFIAAAFMGYWDQSLLKEYFFAEKFLELNDAVFRHYGITPSLQRPVFQPHLPKNSRTRRIGRGRLPL